jgi:hypothetical protein
MNKRDLECLWNNPELHWIAAFIDDLSHIARHIPILSSRYSTYALFTSLS